jgi:group I intron endonuclease
MSLTELVKSVSKGIRSELKCPGIYVLLCAASDSVYVGQTLNLSRREKVHMRDLEQGKHGNVILQRTFDKYGPESIAFIPIWCCPMEQLDSMEQYLLDSLLMIGKKKVVNIRRECVSSNRGIKRSPEYIRKMSESRKGKPKSEEHKAKLSELMQGTTGERSPRYGCRHTEEQKAKMSQAKRGKPWTQARRDAQDARRLRESR